MWAAATQHSSGGGGSSGSSSSGGLASSHNAMQEGSDPLPVLVRAVIEGKVASCSRRISSWCRGDLWITQRELARVITLAPQERLHCLARRVDKQPLTPRLTQQLLRKAFADRQGRATPARPQWALASLHVVHLLRSLPIPWSVSACFSAFRSVNGSSALDSNPPACLRSCFGLIRAAQQQVPIQSLVISSALWQCTPSFQWLDHRAAYPLQSYQSPKCV